MAAANGLERVLRRERAILIGALAVLVTIAALYTILGIGMEMSALGMTAMAGSADDAGTGAAMMRPAQWTPVYFTLVLAMWWVMMIAMMLPSAAPMILLHGALMRRQSPDRPTLGASAAFLAGYLGVWAGFSLAATVLQRVLELPGLVSPDGMIVTSRTLGGLILLAAGAYQFTRLKHACLDHCRNPVQFFTAHYRPGRFGPFRIGLAHGAYCLGCCWILMGLLFFGGIMNLYWIAGLALFVLGEKALPRGDLIGRGAGAGLALWGALLLGSAAGSL